MKLNTQMKEPFVLYTGPKTKLRPVPPTTLAHRIVYLQAEHKGVDVHYLDNGDKLCEFVTSKDQSLVHFKRIHGAGFIQINRNLLVNLEAITGVFPTSSKDFGCSVIGTGAVLPISRRSVKAVQAAFKAVRNESL